MYSNVNLHNVYHAVFYICYYSYIMIFARIYIQNLLSYRLILKICFIAALQFSFCTSITPATMLYSTSVEFIYSQNAGFYPQINI